MADELRRRHTGDLPGVRCREEELHGLGVFTVEILDEQGAQALGKPPGRYYTLRLPRRFERGAESFTDAVEALAELVRRCLPEEVGSVLVAALGNPDITPDALGSLAAGSVLVTRHLKEREPESFRGFCSLALCRPGVLGTSGIESAAQIQTLCRLLQPDLPWRWQAPRPSSSAARCRSPTRGSPPAPASATTGRS